MIESGMYIANRYEIIGKVGVGGMADVYKAKDITLDRFVAVKVLKQEFCEDMSFVTKFRTEAQAAASLEHPNIVNIYDVGSENGIYYIVMEYIDGITLKEYIQKKGRLTYKETLSIVIQVSRGIQAAHEKGIIHRDIKPQNIIISTDGKVKVTDFGIARAASSNTIHSDVMGSVHYASPEQARNGYVSDKSDIYSLGIVMYEMVTGRVPFDGDSTVQIALQHLQDEMITPRTYVPDLPVSLEKIIIKCTQKKPERRYENMDNLLIDLRRALITPNDDFVTIPPVSDGATRIISEDELKQIQEQAGLGSQEEQESEEPYTEEETADQLPADSEYDQIYDEKARKREKLLTTFGIIGAIVIAIIFVLILGNIFGWFNFSKNSDSGSGSNVTSSQEESGTVTMIDLTGMTYSQAKSQLKSMGLNIRQSKTEASDEYDEGQIISQSKDEGEKVKKGTTISVVVSSGSSESQTEVPDVVGKASSEAESLLEDAGFKVSKKFDYSDSVDSGDVISQDPEAGTTAAEGDTVTITISQGAERVKVPNVVGLSLSDAKTALEARGLKVGKVTRKYTNEYPSGEVCDQGGTANTYVDGGSSIDLVVSRGENTTYEYSDTLDEPETEEGVSVEYAKVVLKASDGTTLKTWSNLTSPYSIELTGINGYSSGKRITTWYFSDGSSHTYTKNVTFTQASGSE